MPSIRLSNGMETLVNRETFRWARNFKWSWAFSRGGRFYAARVVKRKTQYLHRLVMGNPPCQVDHRNGNSLDNRKRNLRLASQNQNQANSGPKKGRRFKGVFWRPREKRFVAQITVNRKTVYLGGALTEIAGAKIYDRAAKKFFGRFAKLNFA